MSPSPLVSVIIPTYNYAAYLPQAIDSALAQSYPEREVIVVDDGSTDDTAAVAARYGDRIRYLRQENQGVSAARNHGIAQSRGELIALLDADDTWHPTKLARQVPLFARPEIGLVSCGLEYIDRTGRVLGARTDGVSGRVLREHALFRASTVIAGASTATLRRECFSAVGGFDGGLSTAADWDMWRRVMGRWAIEIVREPLVSYRLHSSAMHRNVALFERDMLRAFRRMFDDPDAREVHAIERDCWANLYLTLAASYGYARSWPKAARYGLKGVALRPGTALAYLAGLPMRRLRRWLRPEGGDHELTFTGHS